MKIEIITKNFPIRSLPETKEIDEKVNGMGCVMS